MRVLVAGGTGRLGSLVVNDLHDAGHQIRVLTRDPRRADHLSREGIEVAVGDVQDPQTLTAACDDVAVVVSAVHGFAGPGRVSPKRVDRDGNANLVRAAKCAGADVVLVSIVGAAPDAPLELARYKYAAEQHLRHSGVPFTIVRATAFVELWAELLSAGIVFGRGENPINFVCVRDVADLVSRAVLDAGMRGRTLELGGPSNVSFNQLSELLREVLGRPTKVRHVPRSLLRLLAPVHRQPRAALVMDTTDFTFGAGTDRVVAATSLGEAISPADSS